MNRQPSLTKIIIIDYLAFTIFLAPILICGLYIFLFITQRINTANFVFPASVVVITLITIGILIWRVRLFYSIFSDGLEASATISNVFFFRDRGRVDYVYTYQGQKYVSGNVIHKVKQTEALQVGDPVVVMIDASQPKRAYIRDLYI